MWLYADFFFLGISMGGFGTWATAAAYPDLFAAILPVSSHLVLFCSFFYLFICLYSSLLSSFCFFFLIVVDMWGLQN